MKKDEKRETAGYEKSPLNPTTNRNYVEEIEKSIRLLDQSKEAEFFKNSINDGYPDENLEITR